MREILFRGKQRTMLDWVEGTGVFNDGTNTWLSANESNKPIACGLNHKIVLPETVGQYTGLIDKNGKKIFEGDILRWVGPDGEGGKVYVEYAEGVFGLLSVECPDTPPDLFADFEDGDQTLEVIGNIHDNPEPLGGEGDGH